MKRIALAALAAIGWTMPAAAQEKQAVAGAVRSVVDCRAEAAEAARLRCYDEAAAELARATENGSLIILDREGVRKTRRSLFGFDVNLPFFRNKDGEEEAPKEIVAKITSVGEAGYHNLLLTLDNGAVWQTTESTPGVRPKSGSEIRIIRALMGSYMVQIGSRRIRARRVR